MPTEQGRRGDEEGDPLVPRDHPARRREEDSVNEPELRLAAGPLEHPELTAQVEDLGVLGSVSSAAWATAGHETGECSDGEV